MNREILAYRFARSMLLLQVGCVSFLTVLVFFAAGAEAATRQAASCSSSDVQTAINAAASGDTVVVPGPCSTTWNVTVTIPSSKGITLNGTGVTLERGSVANGVAILSVSLNTTARTRVTGFTFTEADSASNGLFIRVDAANVDGYALFRLDHLTMSSTGGLETFINVNSSGLIDHCSFTWNANNGGEMIHNTAYGPSSTQGWAVDVTPGSPDAVYIEDNVFTNQISGSPAYFKGGSATQSYYGARTVFRHNVCNNCQIDQHGTAGMVGARWWEIYENTFNFGTNACQSDVIVVRGGSGVIFNNRRGTGSNCTSPNINLYEEDSGYPALYQVGRGKNQVLYPAHLWGNDSFFDVSGDPGQVEVNRDYYMAGKAGYVPYTYPHPLATGSSAPQSPTNLRIVP